jgi:hypothetical protein
MHLKSLNHLFAEQILTQNHRQIKNEVLDIIGSVDTSKARTYKGLSSALKRKFKAKGWKPGNGLDIIDFTKRSVGIGFAIGKEAPSDDLLNSNLNGLEVGIYIVVTHKLQKKIGKRFDPCALNFEKLEEYFEDLQEELPLPVWFLGLDG